jgi:hypothetical protein
MTKETKEGERLLPFSVRIPQLLLLQQLLRRAKCLQHQCRHLARPHVPLVVKAPPAVPLFKLEQRNTEPSVGSGAEVPVLEPVPYKVPPGKRPMASLELNKGSETAFIAPMGSETEGPIVLPSGSASVSSETEFMEIPKTTKVPPPPPGYPAMAHAKLPAGVSLPETGTKAAAEELSKIAGWVPAGAPLGKGIIRPQPAQAEQDFKELIPSWLAQRVLPEIRWSLWATTTIGSSITLKNQHSSRQERKLLRQIGTMRPNGRVIGYPPIMVVDGTQLGASAQKDS